mmetsp:Transcript_21183/g.27498  ORF Transcript_21183/g.27498 Transcript_21183/m.27498 type:complete len:585 (+) Transcript_21183:89-1843(+)
MVWKIFAPFALYGSLFAVFVERASMYKIHQHPNIRNMDSKVHQGLYPSLNIMTTLPTSSMKSKMADRLFSTSVNPEAATNGNSVDQKEVELAREKQGKRPQVGPNKGRGIVERIMMSIISFRAFVLRLVTGISGKANNKLFGRITGVKSEKSEKSKVIAKLLVLGAAIASVIGFKFMGVPGVKVTSTPIMEVGMSDFMSLTSKGRVKEVRIKSTGTMHYQLSKGDLVEGELSPEEDQQVHCITLPVRADPRLLDHLQKHEVPFRASQDKNNSLTRVMLQLFPLLWITGILVVQMRAMRGGGKPVAKRADKGMDIDRSLTFDDVQGVDDAKMEIQEMVNILRNPYPYIKAGVRLPSGVVMVGPPGTGKTLLARVMAAEAKVPFFYCSGSDFVEMFVGRGAARVRSLFQRAQKSAPCIIFFDEIDALGRQRSATNVMGSNNEAEQTLNQLLACMDGLDTNNNGVIVVAATNRFEVLDEALTRPGRFDRVVKVGLPDRIGREQIFRVHTKRLNLDEDVDLMRISELTPGLNGAELASICNEAGIRAVRRNSVEVTAADFSKSISDYFSSRGRSKSMQRILSDGFKIV